METKTFIINGMACAHCKANVEQTLKSMNGVKSAIASVEDKNVTIEYDAAQVSPQQMQHAIDDAGYEMVL
jgi:copper chaperone